LMNSYQSVAAQQEDHPIAAVAADSGK